MVVNKARYIQKEVYSHKDSSTYGFKFYFEGYIHKPVSIPPSIRATLMDSFIFEVHSPDVWELKQ